MKSPRHLKPVSRILRRLGLDETGNATILMALGMPMMIGGAGLSVDFAQYYLWKRELQYATDQAALAAAWELAEKSSSTQYTDRAIREFEANEMITASFNTTPTVRLANYADGVANSVVVSASATKTLPFTSFFTRDATTVSASSQASFAAGAVFTSCLIATDGEADGAVNIGGNSVFTAGCGIAALSTSDEAVTISGNPTVDAGWVVAAGGIDDWFDTHTDDEIHEYVEGLRDPFEDLEPPLSHTIVDQGSLKDLCKDVGKGGGPKKLATINPGRYSDFTTQCNVVLNEGVYVIDGGDLNITGQYSVTNTGRGVIFVLMNGAGIKIVGSAQVGNATKNTDINLTGISGEVLLGLGYSAEYAGDLDGMLVFEDRESEGDESNMIAGTSDTWLSGKIYLPVSEVSFTGTAKVAHRCLMLVADQVTLTGSANMTSFCPSGSSIDDTVATTAGTVKLVA